MRHKRIPLWENHSLLGPYFLEQRGREEPLLPKSETGAGVTKSNH